MSTPIDVARARADTPGCERVLHLNNAGAALPPRAVVETVVAHLRREEAVGGYEAGEDAGRATEEAYTSIARLLHCTPGEVAFAESATRAWDTAFSSLRLGPGDRLLTSRVEYASNYLALLQAARRTGAVVEVVPSSPTGEVDVDALASMLDDRVKLVAVTHVPTQGGLVNPAERIGALTRVAGVPFLLDACQSAGQLPLDVTAIGCDFLSATGRKYLRGPRGTGFLYVRGAFLEERDLAGAPLEPFPADLHGATWLGPEDYVLHPDARRFEQWERSVACLLGLGAAVEYALGWGLDAIRDRVFALAARLREQLAALPGVTVRDEGVERCGIVTFTLAGHDPAHLRRDLRAIGINVSVSLASWARLDLDPRGIPALVRASVHYYNTDEELDRFCAALPPPR